MGNLSSTSKEFKNILKKRGMMSYEMDKEISDSWSRCIAAVSYTHHTLPTIDQV